MNHSHVNIIGGGIAGLTAAFYLKQKGISFTIFEKGNKVGGRASTDEVSGYKLDRGFQVFQEGYPEAKDILDYKSLGLKSFWPGAIISKNKKLHTVADPLRKPQLAFEAIFSPIGSFSDKLKVLKLRSRLQDMNPALIFEQAEKSTYEALKVDYGFSDEMVDDFFRPFFSGIFFENELKTSRRMFDFVYKMFTEGNASLPANGIGGIAQQLATKVGRENIRTQAEVASINAHSITLTTGEEVFGVTLLATAPGKFHKALNLDCEHEGQQCTNFYFEAAKSPLSKPMIMLVADKKSIINTLAVPSDIQPTYAPEGKALISVTTLQIEPKGEKVLQEKVLKELQNNFPNAYKWDLIKTYKIKYALPNQTSVTDDLPFARVRAADNVYVAGDFLMYGSLNAAMKSGRVAAHVIATDMAQRI